MTKAKNNIPFFIILLDIKIEGLLCCDAEKVNKWPKIVNMHFAWTQKKVVLYKEPLIKSGLDFSRDKIFRFKAQIAENSPLFSKFGT